MGKASAYPADSSLRARLPQLDASIAERRKMAWAVVEKVVAPVPLAARAGSGPHPRLPRFQTWYSRDDVLPMFDQLFRALRASQQQTRARFDDAEITRAFAWNATMARSLTSFTETRRTDRLHEIGNPAGLHSLGKDARTLMSPAFVGHLLRSYPEIIACTIPGKDAAPTSDVNFAPCLDGEFPADAAAVKMRWMPASEPLPTYDTSQGALSKKLEAGDFGPGDGLATPDESAIYTMQLTPETSMRLAALHIMTKELRDWAWITIWWSNEPETDFGRDRPASLRALGGPWDHYKMCVVTAFDEKDRSARVDSADPASWCSNPYLEQGAGAAKTSCIGCHQHGGTGESTASVLADGARFPAHGREKVRANFPGDYTFTTSTGLDLASDFRAKVEALTSP